MYPRVRIKPRAGQRYRTIKLIADTETSTTGKLGLRLHRSESANDSARLGLGLEVDLASARNDEADRFAPYTHERNEGTIVGAFA